MKPVLLLQSRPEQAASDDEFMAFCRFGGLNEADVVRVQVHQDVPALNLDDYDFVLMGGGPANFAYPAEQKSAEQLHYEQRLLAIINKIVAADKPFLGACLGVGALVTHAGGRMSFEKGEPVGAVPVRVTPEGASDPLLAGLPGEFAAFVGHKEGVHELPGHVTVLATSGTCPQMVCIGNNVYATQFHPELDPAGLELRINTYKHAGYFKPHEADELIVAGWRSNVEHPTKVLERFVQLYRGSRTLQAEEV